MIEHWKMDLKDSRQKQSAEVYYQISSKKQHGVIFWVLKNSLLELVLLLALFRKEQYKLTKCVKKDFRPVDI